MKRKIEPESEGKATTTPPPPPGSSGSEDTTPSPSGKKKRAKRASNGVRKFTQEEDLAIIKHLEHKKSMPELCKLLADRNPCSVKARLNLLLGRLKASAGE